ncbi:MAG: tetratricopeptide repeat protein [Desulfovibrio sp.]|jgi:tetratricopeptide (TPR) repeat protein|nr:tetratricopeptide repeat protein [Desulfovibrio sp.]
MLQTLQEKFSEVRQLQMQADGYAIWLVWPGGEVNPVLAQTLEEYGGVRVAGSDAQALWFFFNTDVLLASARLAVWARFNHLAVFLSLFPVRIAVGTDGDRNLIFDESLWKQHQEDPQDFRIWVHVAMREMVDRQPGITLDQRPADLPPGMDPAIWRRMEVDGRLPYQSSMGWFAILRPVGSPVDKAFQIGWREFFAQVETVLQRNKYRFLVHDFFLMFPLEGLRQFKNWCRDFLALVARLKAEDPDRYWPSVLAVVERKGLNFNQDLPLKAGLIWDQLTPDYPHMYIRDALMLGEGFFFHNVRFALANRTSDDWVSVGLRQEGGDGGGSLPQLVPVQLIGGVNPQCFYCGQRSHAPGACPARILTEHDGRVWNRVAQLDFSAMSAATREIDARLSSSAEEERTAAIAALIRETTAPGVLLDAFFDIDWILQPRAMRFFWRARSKEPAKMAADLLPDDAGSPVRQLLDDYPERKNLPDAEKELQNLAVRFPKDFRIPSLRGFVALERGDLDKARAYWREAEMSSPFPIVQFWHQLLQARLLEYQSRFAQAMAAYDHIARALPGWGEVAYRKAVCMVKSGFSAQILNGLRDLVENNPHYFNKILLDPEMERGHVQITTFLHSLWLAMKGRAGEEALQLRRLQEDLSSWFLPEHPFAEKMSGQISKLLQLESGSNYVAFQLLVSGHAQVEQEMQSFVTRESRAMKGKFKEYSERLRAIHEESSWFPFPSALVDFNKTYNQSVLNLNWANATNFHLPDAFRKAQLLTEQEGERLKKLEGRLKFLRIVRDATLFFLSVAETFFWCELGGIIIIFVLLPLLLIYGDKIGMDWTASLISSERWNVQKALFFVVSILALGIASLRTILRFETIRDKILAKAKNAPLRKKK